MEVISTNDGSYFYLTENKNDNNLIKRQVLWKCRINQINIGRHYYLNFYLHDTVVINVFQDGPCFLAMNGELISLRLRLYLYRVTMGFLPEPQYLNDTFPSSLPMRPRVRLNLFLSLPQTHK